MEIKLITDKEEYKRALAEVERLIELDPEPGTPEADRLILLAKLIEVYEKEHFSFELPDAIAAIRFRMDEQGLMQRDLVPYIGSKSKVSEILAGRRPLTIHMIRALHEGLGIPAEVLLQEPKKIQIDQEKGLDWKKFPVEEMIRRGWIRTRTRNAPAYAHKIMEEFLAPLSDMNFIQVLYRGTIHTRYGTDVDMYALSAWTARVLIRAKHEYQESSFSPGIITDAFIKELTRLSWFNQGPLLAKEYLEKNGIALIIEKHLPKTKIDGGAMFASENLPIIALTLRYDRLDNFWFALVHELMHIAKHLKKSGDIFLDDLDYESKIDRIEREADRLTREAFIPRSLWPRTDAFRQRTPEAIKKLAEQLRIHPAIIAGRIRYEANNYQILGELVGSGQVRRLLKP